MTTRSQFCPVVKAAEVFGDRWTPIIIRELCFGTRAVCLGASTSRGFGMLRPNGLASSKRSV